jgi:hypothetical protein
MTRISRRTFLRAAGVSLALPALDIMAIDRARPVVRSAFIYYPNGVPEGTFGAAKVGRNGVIETLKPSMAPLDPVKQHIMLPQRMWTPRGNGHGAGTATWLSGGDYDARRIDVGAASVDQRMARACEDETMLPSLELSIKGEGYFAKEVGRNNISWRKSNLPCAREVEPRAVFDRLFRTGDGTLATASVLDQVNEQAKALQKKGSAEDRAKIDEYLEAVRAIEKQIAWSEKQTKGMVLDKALTESLVRPEEGIPADNEAYVRQMLDLMILAFWTDATRVSSFMMDHGQSNRYFNFIPGVSGTWHALSHWKDASGGTEDDDGKTRWNSVGEKKDMYSKVTTWHHAQFAYMLERMATIKDGDAMLLDNCQIVYGSNISDGDEHGENDLPIILAGGGGGALRGGLALRYRQRTSMSKLYLSMMRNMGMKVSRFADARSELSAP